MSVYELVTKKILESMEQGINPWVSPYLGKPNKNLSSGKEYRGINALLLNAVATENGFRSNYWLTFKQANEMGYKVKKGAKATMVIFWKDLEQVEEEDGEEKISKKVVLRYYNVFNTDQLEGFENKEEKTEPKNNILEKYCNAEGIKVKRANTVASFYAPKTDEIVLAPVKEDFFDMNFAHECVHSTGHPKRLKRYDINFTEKADERSFEELVAEIGASMLCTIMGKPAHYDNAASYVSSWAKFLKDKRISIIKASSVAQKAVDYILSK
jgi:antirestriction protein ArdC